MSTTTTTTTNPLAAISAAAASAKFTPIPTLSTLQIITYRELHTSIFFKVLTVLNDPNGIWPAFQTDEIKKMFMTGTLSPVCFALVMLMLRIYAPHVELPKSLLIEENRRARCASPIFCYNHQEVEEFLSRKTESITYATLDEFLQLIDMYVLTLCQDIRDCLANTSMTPQAQLFPGIDSYDVTGMDDSSPGIFYNQIMDIVRKIGSSVLFRCDLTELVIPRLLERVCEELKENQHKFGICLILYVTSGKALLETYYMIPMQILRWKRTVEFHSLCENRTVGGSPAPTMDEKLNMIKRFLFYCFVMRKMYWKNVTRIRFGEINMEYTALLDEYSQKKTLNATSAPNQQSLSIDNVKDFFSEIWDAYLREDVQNIALTALPLNPDQYAFSNAQRVLGALCPNLIDFEIICDIDITTGGGASAVKKGQDLARAIYKSYWLSRVSLPAVDDTALVDFSSNTTTANPLARAFIQKLQFLATFKKEVQAITHLIDTVMKATATMETQLFRLKMQDVVVVNAIISFNQKNTQQDDVSFQARLMAMLDERIKESREFTAMSNKFRQDLLEYESDLLGGELGSDSSCMHYMKTRMEFMKEMAGSLTSGTSFPLLFIPEGFSKFVQKLFEKTPDPAVIKTRKAYAYGADKLISAIGAQMKIQKRFQSEATLPIYQGYSDINSSYKLLHQIDTLFSQFDECAFVDPEASLTKIPIVPDDVFFTPPRSNPVDSTIIALGIQPVVAPNKSMRLAWEIDMRMARNTINAESRQEVSKIRSRKNPAYKLIPPLDLVPITRVLFVTHFLNFAAQLLQKCKTTLATVEKKLTGAKLIQENIASVLNIPTTTQIAKNNRTLFGEKEAYSKSALDKLYKRHFVAFSTARQRIEADNMGTFFDIDNDNLTLLEQKAAVVSIRIEEYRSARENAYNAASALEKLFNILCKSHYQAQVEDQ